MASEGGGCIATPERLCLLENRFAVEVSWTNCQGISGAGISRPLTSDSGLFWFFAPATTDVEYHLRVTESANGARRTFDNTLGTASPAFTSSDAFPCGE